MGEAFFVSAVSVELNSGTYALFFINPTNLISGWIGLVLVVILCITACYGGTRLGICWDIIEERYPEYRGYTRNPYPTIAERAVGRWGRYVLSFDIIIIVLLTVFNKSK